ncbi:uncharacterized protein HMPREF1541_00842 [Cyphellophora europaea CBS 101466]|uniref:SMP-30/Gluconolactonase/LRE-like region domain-containing protein n=1 Tax=Cyphellophora europaea (strain CBS 101466) TaxID=1220924 RepID=W2SD54_CYPE1|nr:uncharacterized protein HMPREF1541_00842 [Cyphellophora europaea CBS 101466]ETN46656.1 hypothetical protein HMPREF1541_00842 [Cyphellophora europaea CBS 101466]
MKTYTVSEPFLDVRCELAEGLYWEASEGENHLRFVDIVKQDVYRVDLARGPEALTKRSLDTSISVTADIADSKDAFIFGGKRGIGIASKLESEKYHRYVKGFWEGDDDADAKYHSMRANDGAVDSQGRFWVGVVNDPLVTEFAPVGALFRYDLDGSLHRVLDSVTIPNGLSWSLDDRTMYFTDSPTRCIYAFDFAAESGTVSNRRVFFQVPEGEGVPDGHAQDILGNLWVALWGGWKVVGISPTGEVFAEIKLPIRCPTVTGEDLYVGSEADPELHKYPDSARYQGAIFRCPIGIRGRKPNLARVKVNMP